MTWEHNRAGAPYAMHWAEGGGTVTEVFESEEIPVKKVRVTIVAEVNADATLDPELYQVKLRSTEDSWFDMRPETVTITEVEP